MRISKLVIIATLLFSTAAARPARAEVGVGFFIFEPTGLDLKVDLNQRQALDFLLGWYSGWRDRYYLDHGGYFHATWLYQPWVGMTNTVAIPLRIGVGGAIFDDRGRFFDDRDRFFDDNDINVAARFPFEIGFRFLGTPVEIYFEIALKLTIIDPGDDHPTADLDGGVGVRFMF